MIRYIISLTAAFFLTVILTPPVIAIARKLKVRQTVLSYVDNHAGKSGTPTMGGVAFTLSAFIVTLVLCRGEFTLALQLCVLTLGFGIIGFLDDFIKVRFKRNEGLTPLQKIIFQVAVAVVMAIFAYRSPYAGDTVYLPFTLRAVNLGWFALPLYAFAFLAFTNAVNLTDGLDGLAAKSGAAYCCFFTAILAVLVYYVGVRPDEAEEYGNLIVFSLALIGALCGFLVYNSFPARVFMGDTGSLALGGALAGLAVTGRLVLFSPIIGIVYVVSCLSYVIQVLHYKRTKRRVFLMAPFHHHLERKGWHENRIVTVYALTTFAAGALTLLLVLVSISS